MQSTLEHGDFVFVWKRSYGYSQFSIPFAPIKFDGRILGSERPKSGDVTVFRYPKNTKINYIKRVIGTPSDVVQVRLGRLYINTQLIPRTPIKNYQSNNSSASYPQYREVLLSGKTHRIIERRGDSPLSLADNTPRYVVPPQHYFMMGDNRDASQDSRFLNLVGYVPEKNLIGRAAFIFFSIDPHVPWWKIWRKFRFNRIGTLL